MRIESSSSGTTLSYAAACRAAVLSLSVGLAALAGCDVGACDEGCPDGQFCCEGECQPEGTTGCACSSDEHCSGVDVDAVCCAGSTTARECRRAAECSPPPQACESTTQCALSGEVCCQVPPLVGMCVADAECPCRSDADCGSIEEEECCGARCVLRGSCEDAGTPDGGSSDGGMSDGGGSGMCSAWMAGLDEGAEILGACQLDGRRTLCSGGDAGQVRFHSMQDGSLIEARDAMPGERIYSVIGFEDPDDSTLEAFVAVGAGGASYFDRQDGTWSFVQRLYGINAANVVQAALLTEGGAVTAMVLANSSSGRVDLVEKNSFGTWTISRSASIVASGRMGGVACIPDTRVCVVGTDADPGEFFSVNWSLPDGDPGLVLALGTSGADTRNGACNSQICVFAGLGAGGAATVLDATMSPPTVSETLPVGPGIAYWQRGSLSTLFDGFLAADSDDRLHALAGTVGALRLESTDGPACEGGEHRGVVQGETDDCIVTSCLLPAGGFATGGFTFWFR